MTDTLQDLKERLQVQKETMASWEFHVAKRRAYERDPDVLERDLEVAREAYATCQKIAADLTAQIEAMEAGHD